MKLKPPPIESQRNDPHWLPYYKTLVTDEESAIISYREFKQLARYDHSMPTGPSVGRVWCRKHVQWDPELKRIARVQVVIQWVDPDPVDPENYKLIQTRPLAIIADREDL